MSRALSVLSGTISSLLATGLVTLLAGCYPFMQSEDGKVDLTELRMSLDSAKKSADETKGEVKKTLDKMDLLSRELLAALKKNDELQSQRHYDFLIHTYMIGVRQNVTQQQILGAIAPVLNSLLDDPQEFIRVQNKLEQVRKKRKASSPPAEKAELTVAQEPSISIPFPSLFSKKHSVTLTDSATLCGHEDLLTT